MIWWAKRAVLLILAALVVPAVPARAMDPQSCRPVRFGAVNWTDVTATTAVVSRLLEGLGYAPSTRIMAVPDIYMALEGREIDAFLGNWMPTMEADLQPYVEDGSVEVIEAPNLIGAKYTLAVPTYLFEAGLQTFSDIARFREALAGKIYGLEAGNDGNRLIRTMIEGDAFGLRGFELVETSEQGMLDALARAVNRREPMVFLGWEPHPMNATFSIRYLAGGDEVFGPNFGGANVFTNVRAGYLDACPNVGTLLSGLRFTLQMESVLMAAILGRGEDPAEAARKWLRGNPRIWQGWLKGVTTIGGEPGYEAVRKSLGL
ncbi:MAG: choline ABC transporter substrate-binding protein [Bauldia sp.]|nr:choline ABC transporter substrate-binding protein [Bauldia sp.]